MKQRSLALGPTCGFPVPVAAKVAELVHLSYSPLATGPGKPTSTCTAVRLRVPREITAASRTGQLMKHQFGMYQAHGVALGFLLLFAPQELQVLILELGAPEVRALLEEIQAARHLVLVLAGGKDVVGAVAATLPSAITEWTAAAKQARQSDALQFFSAFASFSRYIAEAVAVKEISALHGRFAAVTLPKDRDVIEPALYLEKITASLDRGSDAEKAVKHASEILHSNCQVECHAACRQMAIRRTFSTTI